MNTPPPLHRDQRAVDRDHLNLLAIFHFVVAGLAFLSLGFLAVHFAFMRAILDNPEMLKGGRSAGPPPEFLAMFKWFYAIFSVAAILAVLGNLLSGFYIRARRNRTFSIVVAALDCLQVPFGTVLGVFTIIVLVRESVRELYESGEQT